MVWVSGDVTTLKHTRLNCHVPSASDDRTPSATPLYLCAAQKHETKPDTHGPVVTRTGRANVSTTDPQ